MATMSVWKFPTAKGAQNALDLVKDLKKQHLITLHDAAIVTWPEGKKKPKTKQLVDMASAGALDGAFWGILFGLIFFPLFGMVVGAAMGALAGAFTDVGIDDEFIKKVGSEVTEGTSALFLMTSEAVLDKVAEATKGMAFELLTTNLSKEEEDKLRTVFA